MSKQERVMSDAEQDEPRFQGSDDDEFVSAMPEVVYGQDDGEEMAQKIITLEADNKRMREAIQEHRINYEMLSEMRMNATLLDKAKKLWEALEDS